MKLVDTSHQKANEKLMQRSMRRTQKAVPQKDRRNRLRRCLAALQPKRTIYDNVRLLWYRINYDFTRHSTTVFLKNFRTSKATRCLLGQEPAAASEAAPEAEAPWSPWSDEEVTLLRRMKDPAKRWSWPAIAKRLNRSETSVRLKWSNLKGGEDLDLGSEKQNLSWDVIWACSCHGVTYSH